MINNQYLLKKLGSALDLTSEEKQISFLNNYFIFKKIRNVEYEPDELVSKKQNNKDRDTIEASIKEFDEVDQNFEENVKESLDIKSKKLAEKYLQDSQKLEDIKHTPMPSVKIKLSVDEKIKLAEQTKKLKLEEKLKSQQEKQALKEIEKSKKAEEKEKLKRQKEKKILKNEK